MSKKKKAPPPTSYYVFAYGSNMNRRQMAFRCPSAQSVCVARLDGYRLTFAGHNSRWGGGVATILPARRSTVVGVVWRLTAEDLARLDEFEGFPFVYDRAAIVVRPVAGGQFWCHTYVKNASEAVSAPSEDYLRVILDGYHAAGARVPVAIKRLFDQVRSQTAAAGAPMQLRIAGRGWGKTYRSMGGHGIAA